MSKNQTTSNANEDVMQLQEDTAFGDIFDILVRYGYVADPKITNTAAQKRAQTRQKKFYQQTKILLSSYRDIVWTLQEMPAEMARELDTPLDGIGAVIESVSLLDNAPTIIDEYHIRSLKQSKAMIDYVNGSLMKLKTRPVRPLKPGRREPSGEELYDALYQTYICPQSLTREVIMEKLNLTKRTYYRHINLAVAVMSDILWGGGSPMVNAMIEVIGELTQQREDEVKEDVSVVTV